jgi:hypothetical protein
VPETTGSVLFVGAVGVRAGVAQERTPEPFVINTCPAVPSVFGNVQVTLDEIRVGALKAT